MRRGGHGSRESRPEQKGGRERKARRDRNAHPAGAPPRGTPSDASLVLLYGFHSVREALRAGRRKLVRLYATKEAADRLASEIEAAGVPLALAAAADLSARLGREAVHQGLLLEARASEGGDMSDLEGAGGIVLVLDQVTDPHNFGAILRSAAAFGVEALVTTHRHSPALTGVLAKAASGGLEHVSVITVTNLARALDALGNYGFLRIGLDSEGPAALDKVALSKPVALVLGAEGQGLRRLTRERCDILARLDMPGPIKSLNVSNACAVALTLITQGFAQQASRRP